jgi:tetratricopeptide (TPR) repeat protein
MALFDAYNKKSILKAAVKQTNKARENEGDKADQLFISAYEGFADVVKDDLVRGEALYHWGFALLHQAKLKDEVRAIKLYLDAISKFTFCLLVQPNHLGAAIDGGVAYMDLARIMDVDGEDELYDLALEFFENAERIQRGSAAYNLACIRGLRGQDTACLEALELSRECGSLPNTEDIKTDTDLAKMNQTQWFIDFIEKIAAGSEPVVVDENEVSYDVEGNVVNKNKKKKQFENEVDGVVYDAEGNVLRSDKDTEQEAVETKSDTKPPETMEIEKSESVETPKPEEKTFMGVELNKGSSNNS